MHSSLLKVGEATVRHLHITVDGDGSRGLISLISYEVTAYQVDTAPWKTDKSTKLLI
jgi:hypothetical protein